jgi:hypothetical protein
MSDTREALARAILVNAMCPGQEYIAARVADAILAEFLVVPRDSIVGTEYGWRQERGWSVVVAHSLDAIRHWEETKGGEAVTRPDLPWSVIPLPENGEPR